MIKSMNYKSILSSIFCLLPILLENVRSQEDTTDEKEIENETESVASLYSLIFFCFLSACGSMLLFFCLKIYLEMRLRNRPVVNYGPFGDLRDVCLDELTSEQRKAIVDVVFSEETCTKFDEKIDENEETDKVEKFPTSQPSANYSPTSIMCTIPHEESAFDISDRHNNKTHVVSLQPLPELSTSRSTTSEESNENHSLLKVPPSLKRRPLFFTFPTNDDDSENDFGMGTMKNEKREKTDDQVDEEVGMQVVSNDCTKGAMNKEEKGEIDSICDYDPENGVCSICIDAYEHGDEIIKSPHCPHFFHKECLFQWFDKSFCCPVCRVDMISRDEIIGAIATIVKENGGIKTSTGEICAQINDTTPRHAGVSSLGSLRSYRAPLEVS